MEPEVVIIMGGVALVGAVPGFLLGRFSGGRAALVLVAVLAVLAVVLLVMGRRAQGWDALTYGIASMIFAMPAAVGAALGGWLGAWLRLR